MKKIFIVINILLITMAVWASIRGYNLKQENRSISEDLEFKNNSLQRNMFRISYLEDLVKVNQKKFRDSADFTNVMALQLDDSTRKPVNLHSLFTNKNTLILRYTEIGCNACVDSVITRISEMKQLRDKFQILIIVDFSNNEYFQKWRKVTEVTLPVYWVKRGSIPLPAERTNNSYLFVVSKKMNVESIFIPKSQLVYYLDSYFNDILAS